MPIASTERDHSWPLVTLLLGFLVAAGARAALGLRREGAGYGERGCQQSPECPAQLDFPGDFVLLLGQKALAHSRMQGEIMLIAGDFGVGQVLWSILWFFLFVMWMWLIIVVFADIMGSPMSGWGKALWTIGIIVLPFLGVFMYLIVHGDGMDRRADAAAADSESATTDYIRSVAGTGSAADQLQKLAALHESGSLTDDEYARAKANLIGAS
jgi:hypothetical protein